MIDSRPSVLGMTLLVGGILLLGLLAAVVFAPLWRCPSCEIFLPKSNVPFRSCAGCGDRGKVSLYGRWKAIQALRLNGIDNVHLFP